MAVPHSVSPPLPAEAGGIRAARRLVALTMLCLAAGAVSCGDSPYVPPTDPTSYFDVAAGGAHSCAFLGGGALYCWGRGINGQLGTGELGGSPWPVLVSGGGILFSSVALGSHHSCGIETDSGEILCWGWNHFGQLGVGTTSTLGLPAPVVDDERFTDVTAGFFHTCGTTEGGDAWCWGDNSQGQLGGGIVTPTSRPVLVAGGHEWAQLSAGGFHTCGIALDGSAWCWGLNFRGQLGTGATNNSPEPVRVDLDAPVATITAGAVHSCAITVAGAAFCWGSNRHGELGDGDWGPGQPADAGAPVPVPVRQAGGSPAFTHIDAGLHFTCAIDSDGHVWCWGLGYDGQLGTGESGLRSLPQRIDVDGRTRFTSVSAGFGTHACAASPTRGALCWGTSHDGALGTGRTSSNRPYAVPSPQ